MKHTFIVLLYGDASLGLMFEGVWLCCDSTLGPLGGVPAEIYKTSLSVSEK